MSTAGASRSGISARLALLRGLGPWARPEVLPKVDRRTLTIAGRRADDRAMEGWLYVSPTRRPRGAFLIAPGLHFDGPADPRLDRFCRVLADAGFVVLAPFLPDHVALRFSGRSVGDLARALLELRAAPEMPKGAKPGLFSISFGSLPALMVAASPLGVEHVGGVVTFGGYGDLQRTLLYCAVGDGRGGGDPLNLPVVFMNLLPHMVLPDGDQQQLLSAWRRFVQATWSRQGRQDMREAAAYVPIARDIATDLPEALRTTFLRGCRAESGGPELARELLATHAEHWAALDPRAHLGQIACPVHLAHAVTDDVVPVAELDALRAAFPPGARVSTYRTGLYGHTESHGWSRVARVGDVLHEASVMWRMLQGVVDAGSVRTEG